MAESLHILLGTSACLQWLCHSGERNVARGPLVFLVKIISHFRVISLLIKNNLEVLYICTVVTIMGKQC